MNNTFRSATVLSLVLATPVFAGTVFEFETTELDGQEPILSTVQMSTAGTNTRLEIISVTSDEAGGLIYRGDSKEMIILDHLQGQYISIDQNQMNAMASQVGSAMAQMEEALAQMPPEQRAMAEQMMKRQFATQQPPGQVAEPPTVINSLNSRGEVAGVPCRNYEVLRNARKIRELCVADWNDLRGGQETATAIRGVVDFFEGMRQAFAGAGGMDVFDRQKELFGHMGELDGYPVLYRDFGTNGKLLRETRLTAARQKEIAPSFFSPPPTYTLQEIPTGMN